MEESPVGEHQANGSIENGITDVKHQFRTLKDTLGTMYGHKYSGEHPSMPWLFKHAADVINRTRIGTDGKTAFRRWKGASSINQVAEFGETLVNYDEILSARTKFNTRWHERIYLGVINDSGETIVGTNQGLAKAIHFRITAIYSDRWNT